MIAKYYVCNYFQLAEKLREFARWKDVECPYEKVHSVAELLQTYPVMGEEGKCGNIDQNILLRG